MTVEKGIVLSSDGKRSVVLTPDGQFRTVPRAGTVGQEIEFSAGRPRWRVLLAAASLVMVLVAGTLFTSLFPVAGYVSVDINPSIELGMNAWGRVVRAQGLNADGQTLLRNLPLYGSTLDRALSQIVRQAAAMHYLQAGNPDNTVVVTYTPGRLAFVRLKGQEEIYQVLSDELERERTPAKVVFARMTAAQRHEATRLGLSAGKYLVRERLLARGLNVPVQVMMRTPIAQLLRAEKLRLDAILGPGTVYREVVLPGMAMSHEGTARATAAPAQRAAPQRRAVSAAPVGKGEAAASKRSGAGFEQGGKRARNKEGGQGDTDQGAPVWPMVDRHAPSSGQQTSTGRWPAPRAGGSGMVTGM